VYVCFLLLLLLQRYSVFQVKFSINAYNMCDLEGGSFNDKMVESTVAVVKREAVLSVLSHFQEGMNIFLLLSCLICFVASFVYKYYL
jgi:hypothetical protein